VNPNLFDADEAEKLGIDNETTVESSHADNIADDQVVELQSESELRVRKAPAIEKNVDIGG
jgi:hypothetical protein